MSLCLEETVRKLEIKLKEIQKLIDVYWYGKYYPKEYIDALFKDNKDDADNEVSESSNAGWFLLALAGLCGVGYGIKKIVIPMIKRKKEEKVLKYTDGMEEI